MASSWDIRLASACETEVLASLSVFCPGVYDLRQPSQNQSGRLFTFVKVLVSTLDSQWQARSTLKHFGYVHRGDVARSAETARVEGMVVGGHQTTWIEQAYFFPQVT